MDSNERVLYCESEIQVLRDTIWRLTSRVYQLENFIQKHFGYRTREYSGVSNNNDQAASSVVTTTPSETPPQRHSPAPPPAPSPPQMFPFNISQRQQHSSIIPKTPPPPSHSHHQHHDFGYQHHRYHEVNTLYSGINAASLFHSGVLPPLLNPTHHHSTRSLGRSTSQLSNNDSNGEDESRSSRRSGSSVPLPLHGNLIAIKTEKDIVVGPSEGSTELLPIQAVNHPRAYWKSRTTTSDSVQFEDVTDNSRSSHSSAAGARVVSVAAGSSSGGTNTMQLRASPISGTTMQGVIHTIPANPQPHSSSSSQQGIVVKNHVCVHCNKKFKRAQELTVHTRIHTGEKPYSCPVCFKKFSQSSSVTLHLPVHTGWKPYKCNVCSKAFARLSHMKKHVKNIHGSGTGTHMI